MRVSRLSGLLFDEGGVLFFLSMRFGQKKVAMPIECDIEALMHRWSVKNTCKARLLNVQHDGVFVSADIEVRGQRVTGNYDETEQLRRLSTAIAVEFRDDLDRNVYFDIVHGRIIFVTEGGKK